MNAGRNGASGIEHFARAKRNTASVFHHALRRFINGVQRRGTPLGVQNRFTSGERSAVFGVDGHRSPRKLEKALGEHRPRNNTLSLESGRNNALGLLNPETNRR